MKNPPGRPKLKVTPVPIASVPTTEETHHPFLVQLRRDATLAGYAVSPFAQADDVKCLSSQREYSPVAWVEGEEDACSLSFVDKAGNWKGVIGINGDATITLYSHPNLNSRTPGQRFSTDQVITVDDLDAFIETLTSFRYAAYMAIDCKLQLGIGREQMRIDAINAESERNARPEPVDPNETTLLALGSAYGFALSGEPLIYALADALGIPKDGRISDDIRSDILIWASEQKDT